MERFLSSAAALLCAGTLTPAQAAASYDLRHHWSASAVNTLETHHILSGYEDGTFRPDQLLTQEEFLSALLRLTEQTAPELLSAEPVAQAASHPDLSGRWSAAVVARLEEHGLLDPVDGDFYPMARITRAQTAQLLDRYVDRKAALAAQPSPAPSDPPVPQESALPAPEASEAPAPEASEAPSETPAASEEPVPSAAVPSPSAAPEAEDRADAMPSETPAGADPEAPAETAEPSPEPEPSPTPAVTPGHEAGAPAFSDTADSAADRAVAHLKALGIVHGSGDGLFHPDDAITRAEAAQLLFQTSGYTAEPLTYAPLPTYQVTPVPYISQLSPVYAPVGCEGTSLLMGLKGKGYAKDVDLREFLTAMPKDPSDPSKGFAGSPFQVDQSIRTTIYPNVLARFGSQYGPVKDLTGADIDTIHEELLLGHPVVAYVTLWWNQPSYRWYNVGGTKQRLLNNNHAVLVTGYDSVNDRYYIADPYNKKDRSHPLCYWIDGATFDRLYLVRRHAVSVC